MRISNFKFQISNLSVLIAIGLVGLCAQARGDGGTLRLSQRCGDLQVSVFTAPAVPRVGMIDISVLVQDAAKQRIIDDLPVTIRLQRTEPPAMLLQQTADRATATNRLFQAAMFDVPIAGGWQATVVMPETKDSAPIAFALEIAPPLPPWIQLAPWIGWPFVVMVMFVIHQRLAARR